MTDGAVSLYGLTIRSELPLHGRPVSGRPSHDIDIRMAEEIPRPDGPPQGRTMVHVEADVPYLTCVARDDGYYVARFYGNCDFVIDPALATVDVHMFERGDVGMAGVFATGTLLSFVLAVRGDPVLHASAVQIEDSALAFVGRSGMGKSTMATLMCAAGADLVTDDVLRLDLSGSGLPTCYLGATELRLRKAAGDLGLRFGSAPRQWITADSRNALQPAQARTDRLPLAAIVIPFPDRELPTCEVRRLPTAEAVLSLVQFPRVLGWEDPDILGRQFEQVVDIAKRTPVFIARVPWGPPFSTEIPAAIATAVGLNGSPQSLSR